MAKQTLKARRSLKKGSLRRKTPAPKAETQKKTELVAVTVPDEDYWRQRAYLMQNAYPPLEPVYGPREMIAPDIGCLNWQTHDGRDVYLRIIRRPDPAKPSLLSRIKAWWRR